jgi:hypothetical protein
MCAFPGLAVRNRDTALVDARLKSFEAETRNRFDFLVAAGFDPPRFVQSDRGIRSITATYRRSDALVETALTLGYMGEETVRTVLQTVDGREELGCGTAHTAFQMKKALETQAGALAQAIKAIGQ